MSMPSSNWATGAFRRAFQKTFTNVFYSRGISTRRRRSRRPAQQISLESLEPRQMLSVNYQMTSVGNPGNAPDTSPAGYGAVSYDYQIGKYDVTVGQYAEFLNAKAQADPYGLYNASMGTDQISRSGTSGSYTYAVKNSTGNRPVTYVSWFDSARFSNWMSNGQGSTSTETGGYTLINGQKTGNAPAANDGAGFRIPTENEWYKAAYFSPDYRDSEEHGYYNYATQSDTLPGTTIGSSANQANYNNAIGTATDVGSFTGSGSFYGTFDQTGNVYQWNDLDGTPSYSRGLRGGSWDTVDFGGLSSSGNRTTQNVLNGSNEDKSTGFRLVTRPTVPGSPTSVVAVRGNTSLAVTWTAPVSTVGSNITEYLLKYSSNDGTSWTRFRPSLPITTTSCTVTDLPNGTNYVIKVIARNAVGIGQRSANSASASPGFVVPSSPTAVVAVTGIAQLAVTWTAPTSTGGSIITDYIVKYSSDSGSKWTNFADPVSTATSCTVTGLNSGTPYVIKVVAKNAIGNSLPSADSAPVTPLAAALTPTFGSTTATADGFTVLISNYDSSYTWAGTATAAGSVVVSSTGLVRVTGVALATSSIATITTTKLNTVGGSATVTATSLAVAMSMMTVGNPGNAADTNTGSLYGAVSYSYQIGKYDVTGLQYTAFLNAVGSTDTYALYNASMGTVTNVAQISQSGTSGSYTYAVINNTGNRPISYVSWFDSARFSNWMSNGQPRGAQSSTTTENGAYNLNGATSGNAVAANATNPNTSSPPTFRIPLENEWYKAAYYSPNYRASGVDGYYLYATERNAAPGTTIGSSPNQANYAQSGNVILHATDVGSFSGSGSFYGTFDQSGNVWQWNDLGGAAGSSRGFRGGSWFSSNSEDVSSSVRGGNSPSDGYYVLDFSLFGFRLASPVTTTLTPTFGSTTATADGFTVPITNYDSSYTWAGTATASSTVVVSSTGLVTVTGVAAATSSTATITTTKAGTVGGSATVTATSLPAALTPTFGATTSTTTGFTVQIANYNASYTWAGTATASGVVVVNSTGLVTVTGLALGTSSTATITTTRTGYANGSATVTATSAVGAALTPTFGARTSTATGFRMQISNYDLSYIWAGTATASGSVSVSSTGLVKVTGVAAVTSSTATITTTRTGYASGSATVTATSLAAALTPTFGATTSTATGFTVQISNFNASYTWAGTATESGSVLVSSTGLVTVTGVAAGTSSTATITTTRTGYASGPATVTATSVVGAALNPAFGSTTATANGFTVQINNYNASYTWAGTATALGSVVVSGTGLVTVTGVAAGTSSTATITTTRTGYASGSATVTATSLITMSMVTVGYPGNAADTTGYGAVSYSYQIGAYDVTGLQYTAFLNAVGSTDTYGLYNASMGTDTDVAQISRSGTSGTYTYAVLNSTGNRPITYVSWFDCARFSNWMSNGQPSGAQTSTTTENGAYNVDGVTVGNAVRSNSTNPNTGLPPTYRMPLQNEWYKAAYYSPNYGGSGIGGYYPFATQSSSAPGTTIGSGANQANYNDAIGRATDVGAFSGSGSFYGTFDQTGNVWQWNDLDGTAGSFRGIRGGSWAYDFSVVSSAYHNDVIAPGSQNFFMGFRLASSVVTTTLTPTFGASWSTADGFVVPITNYDSSYTWAGTATASGTVVVSSMGFVIVIGLANGTSSTATITTTKPNTVGGSAQVTAVNMRMVTVGNPLNIADYNPVTGIPYGAVSYSYQIGKYDVTGLQYTAFLNAVGSTDTYGLYNTSMGTDARVAQISRSGASGTYTYAVMNSTGNRPISYVSWFDSARFSNWMSNGQPSGAQSSTTTENGAYNVNGGHVGGNVVAANATNPNTGLAPTYRLPTENEWYKAAYYSPNLGDTVFGYYIYATQSDTAPGTTIGSGANQANYKNAIGHSTDVGSFSGSGSFYGTFDQNGNVYQWTDGYDVSESSRMMRGGAWDSDAGLFASSFRFDGKSPWQEYYYTGFRLASPV